MLKCVMYILVFGFRTEKQKKKIISNRVFVMSENRKTASKSPGVHFKHVLFYVCSL